MARVSSLESQVLEGRAALASAEADKTGMMSELAVTRETVGRVEELKAALAETATREEALRVEMTASKSALEVGSNPLLVEFIYCRKQIVAFTRNLIKLFCLVLGQEFFSCFEI